MGVMPKPAAPVYRTTNWPEYNAALKRRVSLEIWFDPKMHWLSVPCGRPGRPMRFSDSAIELCLTAEDAVQPAFAASDGIGGPPNCTSFWSNLALFKKLSMPTRHNVSCASRLSAAAHGYRMGIRGGTCLDNTSLEAGLKRKTHV